MDSVEIRERFTDYFENMGYQSLPRAPMIDPSIPMSFVMSAGLVQVENSLAKSSNRGGNQYVLVQECFRHFDLEKVGTDDIHLSLFEMPGAFVFGPDGKSGTVRRMWTLATSVLGLEKEHIWSTYFNGGQVLDDNLPEDIETRNAWRNSGIPENHIVGLGTDHNYWIQGKGIDDASISKKCGPNTELFYDRGIERTCSKDCKPGCKCGRFVEFSNSLFICSEISRNSKSIQPLDNPFTETVIGTERVSMIRQKAASVFDTREFRPILDTLREYSNYEISSESLIAQSEKVIVDHLRALFFLISDGAPPPGKNGRERIIKMLIRRVITRLLVLGINTMQCIPLLTISVSKTITEKNQEEKERVGSLLIAYFQKEFQRFIKTIERGKSQLIQILDKNNGNTLSGAHILYLEKQWGLPSLLTSVVLRKRDLVFEESEYREVLSIANDSFSYDGSPRHVNT
jgi:alanyl-tRNA synthetase